MRATHGVCDLDVDPTSSNCLSERLWHGVIPRYDIGMKTAISVPDDIFESADTLADELGVSRSELYSTAVAEYLAKHRDQDVTARLNRVYSEQDSVLEPGLRSAQRRGTTGSEW